MSDAREPKDVIRQFLWDGRLSVPNFDLTESNGRELAAREILRMFAEQRIRLVKMRPGIGMGDADCVTGGE